MLTETIDLFEKHKPIYQRFIKHGLLIDFHIEIQHDLLKAFNYETNEDYDYNERCYECVAAFIYKIYCWYNDAGKLQQTTNNTA